MHRALEHMVAQKSAVQSTGVKVTKTCTTPRTLFISPFLFGLVEIVECVHELSDWLKFNSSIYTHTRVQFIHYIALVYAPSKGRRRFGLAIIQREKERVSERIPIRLVFAVYADSPSRRHGDW